MRLTDALQQRARRHELRWLADREGPPSASTYIAVALMYAIGLVASLLITSRLADWTTPDDGQWWPWLLVWPLLPLGAIAVAGCAVGLLVWLATGRRDWD